MLNQLKQFLTSFNQAESGNREEYSCKQYNFNDITHRVVVWGDPENCGLSKRV